MSTEIPIQGGVPSVDLFGDGHVAPEVVALGNEFEGIGKRGIRLLLRTQTDIARKTLERNKDPEAQAKAIGEMFTRLSIEAQIDPLTNLLNRRGIETHAPILLEEAAKNKQGIGLAFIDLDLFKKRQDIYGHDFGDTVLESTARSLIMHTRESDVCARYGGDEFLIIAAGPIHGIDTMLRRVRGFISEDIVQACSKNGIRLDPPITTSIGYTYTSTPTANSYEKLITQADRALYTAKETGRNRLVQAH